MKNLSVAVVATPLLMVLACGSSSSSTTSTPAATSAPGTPTTGYGLRGTFVPEGDASVAQFASLSFTDGSHYASTRANCDSGTCSSQGTYTYRGSDLELTDSVTHATEHVDFEAVAIGDALGGGTTTQSVHVLDGTLISDGGSVVTSGSSLLKQVIEGLVNGLLMKVIGGSNGSESVVADAGATPGTPPKGDVDVEGAIEELQAQLASAPLQPYYQDGTRVEGCWLNPVGSSLSDIQKAFYCSMPLEFRLCNSLFLLTSDDTQVDERWREYLQCEQRVDSIAGGDAQFLYDAKVNATYYWLFLNKDSELSASDDARVAASTKPATSGKSFTTLRTAIGESLATEGASAAFPGLTGLVNEASSAASAVNQSID